ncbi:aminotransferase class V-fold PLP-dependent enzyme [uncultured Brachyspira sp.]|uniref:aminotransferase class V-fold PLP-dependent enzyme n=1 Tax=uncultured Brachyspira sp. TaxID=221953 RepID=UPI0025F1ADFE|nr:aminotransferase class V-fold PLP-dependent enzyme [uncultured Brachyspira sp.]
MKNYYFDNSTTSFPKPKEVAEEMYNFLMNIGGTYGRVNTIRGKETTEKIEECRELLAYNFLGTKNDSNVIFTSGATRSINDILIGLNLNNTNILISALEHNAVLRPIYKLSKNKNVKYSIIPSLYNGIIDTDSLSDIIKKEKISLVIVNMESNISGIIQPIKKIKETIGDIPLLVDATQSIGIHNIKADDWNADFIVFTGHKGLLGPAGTGGFYVKNPDKLNPAYFGGGFGDGYETPYNIPQIYESGTPNTVGIIGLLAALKNRPNWNIDINDVADTIKKIEAMNKYKVIWSEDINIQGFLFSIKTINNDINMSNITHTLYENYNIECRYGFHCSFLAHNFYKNDNGAIRFSFSPYTTKEDLEYLINALGN